MAATPSVKIVKQFSFKGLTKSFTNRYHFNGGTPADNAHWDTLFDAIVTAEKAIYSSLVEIVSAVGYAAGSDLPVHAKAYTTVGTFAPTHGFTAQGQSTALVRYGTTARSSKNHPVYLFNYYHGTYYQEGGTNADKLQVDQRTAMGTYAAHWISGFSDGSITAVRAGPNGATATGYLVEEWLTHRDFPYSTSV